MRSHAHERGYTLLELLIVVGTILVVVGTLGAFSLAGPSPAVASAARDVGNALAETGRTAQAFAEATLVVTAAGNGYSARVYRGMPGSGEFAPVDGPTYDSAVGVSETAAPLGAPGFALRIDARGRVTGYRAFTPAQTAFDEVDCPSTGSFVLQFVAGRQKQTVTVPCTIDIAAVTPGVTITPALPLTPAPYAPGTCTPASACNPPLTGVNATCPPGYTPGATPYVCTSPAAPAAVTVTVCNVAGDPNYNLLVGTTQPGNPPTQYVGSSAVPPCSSAEVQPSPESSPTAAAHAVVEALCMYWDGFSTDTFGDQFSISGSGCGTFLADGTVASGGGSSSVTCGQSATSNVWGKGDQSGGSPWSLVDGSSNVMALSSWSVGSPPQTSQGLPASLGYYDPRVAGGISALATVQVDSTSSWNSASITGSSVRDTYCPGY